MKAAKIGPKLTKSDTPTNAEFDLPYFIQMLSKSSVMEEKVSFIIGILFES